MAQSNPDALIGAFLRSLLPRDAELAYTLLASLTYPIPDALTFQERLKRAKGDAETTRLLASLFEPEDFGMDTVESAFEKFAKRGRHLTLPGVPLPRARLQVLTDVINGGGLEIGDTVVTLRSRGAVNVDCSCTDAVGNAGQGSCQIIIQGNVLVCSSGTCKGSCTLVTTIPTSNMVNVRVLG